MSTAQRRTVMAEGKAEEKLFSALRQRARGQTSLVRVTTADAVAMSGLPTAEAEPALKGLVKRYRSHLAVTEDGDLIYAFDPSLERRDRVTLRERMAALASAGYRGFQLVFKVWIMVTLVVYVLAFLAMMISLVLARQGSDDRDDRRGGGGGFPWIWFWLMPDLQPQTDYYGRPIRRLQSGPKKRFYQVVFDYVFGPKVAPVDPRESDRRLISYLRDHQGRIAAADLVALTGLSFDEADEELTRLLVEYDGEVTVADDGTLLYAFDELQKSADLRGDLRWRYAWDQAEKDPPLTGNSGAANAVVSGFAGFNLLASMTIGPAFLERVHLGADPTALFFVTWFPLIFSVLFFSVPALRLVRSRRKKVKAARRTLRRALLRELWASAGQPVDPKALTSRIAERVGTTPDAAGAQLEALLRELEGDVTTDEAGNTRYLFPRLATEQRVVEAARLSAPKQGLGEVVFSSDD
jgi:hypothetical protein